MCVTASSQNIYYRYVRLLSPLEERPRNSPGKNWPTADRDVWGPTLPLPLHSQDTLSDSPQVQKEEPRRVSTLPAPAVARDPDQLGWPTIQGVAMWILTRMRLGRFH